MRKVRLSHYSIMNLIYLLHNMIKNNEVSPMLAESLITTLKALGHKCSTCKSIKPKV